MVSPPMASASSASNRSPEQSGVEIISRFFLPPLPAMDPVTEPASEAASTSAEVQAIPLTAAAEAPSDAAGQPGSDEADITPEGRSATSLAPDIQIRLDFAVSKIKEGDNEEAAGLLSDLLRAA